MRQVCEKFSKKEGCVIDIHELIRMDGVREVNARIIHRDSSMMIAECRERM